MTRVMPDMTLDPLTHNCRMILGPFECHHGAHRTRFEMILGTLWNDKRQYSDDYLEDME
jgi:hypothetical protein